MTLHRQRKRLGLRPMIVSEQEIDFLLARDYELTRSDDFLADSVLEGHEARSAQSERDHTGLPA